MSQKKGKGRTKQIAESINNQGGETIFILADMMQEEQIEEMVNITHHIPMGRMSTPEEQFVLSF